MTVITNYFTFCMDGCLPSSARVRNPVDDIISSRVSSERRRVIILIKACSNYGAAREIGIEGATRQAEQRLRRNRVIRLRDQHGIAANVT